MASLRSRVGLLIRHHRERAGLTQAELADQAERSHQLIGRIERGQAAPSFETLEVLSTVLNTPVRDFFGAGEHDTTTRAADALDRLLGRVAGLNQADLEWLDRLVGLALSRRPSRG